MSFITFIKDRLGTPNVDKMKRKGDIEGLIKALLYKIESEKGSNIRMLTALALGELCNLKAVDPLIQNLQKDFSDTGRSSAAIALGMIGDDRAIDPLIENLSYPNLKVVSSAVAALSLIGSPALDSLAKAVNKGKSYQRQYAAEALGNIGDIKSVEPLLETLKSKGHAVFRAAAKALMKIGDSRAVEPLIEALRDPYRAGSHVTREVKYSIASSSSENKDVCLKALESITGKDFGDSPATWQDWCNKHK